MFLLSISLAPFPLNGILSGLILYVFLRQLTLGSVHPQLGKEDSDPLPRVSAVTGGIVIALGLFLTLRNREVSENFSWLVGTGITLILYAYGMPWIRRMMKPREYKY